MKNTFYPFTAAGAYHAASGAGTQDAVCAASNKRYRAAALADGVSSCAHGAAGAEIASKEAVRLFTDRGDCFFAYAPARAARYTLEAVGCRLQAAADEAGTAAEAFSSTLMCAAYDGRTHTLLTLNLGDGLILGLAGNTLRVLSQPFNSAEGGCCVTTTENAAAAAHVAVTAENLPDTVLLCTDGAWQQMYGGALPKPEVKAMLLLRDFKALGRFLTDAGSFDDCSFVAMKL